MHPPYYDIIKSGERLDKKITNQIKSSDCVVVLLTQNGIRSNWVQQEIGIALNNKPIIPIVEKGIDQRELAILQGIEYIEYDSLQYQQALTKLSTYIKKLKLKKEEQEKILLVLGCIIGFLFLLLYGGRK